MSSVGQGDQGYALTAENWWLPNSRDYWAYTLSWWIFSWLHSPKSLEAPCKLWWELKHFFPCLRSFPAIFPGWLVNHMTLGHSTHDFGPLLLCGAGLGCLVVLLLLKFVHFALLLNSRDYWASQECIFLSWQVSSPNHLEHALEFWCHLGFMLAIVSQFWCFFCLFSSFSLLGLLAWFFDVPVVAPMAPL